MPVSAIDYGKRPRANEFEVTIFGPGYGEALAVHLGNDKWVLVDSCVERGSKTPASSAYLESIGVPVHHVRAIVASHWHDDHVRGISQLVKTYSSADFFYPGVFQQRDAVAFMAAHGGVQPAEMSRGTRELYEAFSNHRGPIATLSRVIVLEDESSALPVRAVAFSPTSAAFSEFLKSVFSYVPQVDSEMPIGHAPNFSPNLVSIVLHVDLGNESLLLGSDLETHATLGWESLIQDSWCNSKRSAKILKVPHHGSASGDHPRMWTDLVEPDPIALLSPFHNGRQALPTQSDRLRIQSKAKSAFITSVASKKAQLPTEQLRRLNDICADVQIAQNGFGAVRARKSAVATDWTIELFGNAGKLQ